MKFGNINLQGIGEIQNANIQNLPSAPTTNLKKGRFYFDTTDNTLYVYNGTQWVNALSQGGGVYSGGTGINISGTVISIDNEVVAVKNDLDDYIPLTQKGSNNGVATLDNTGKVPISQIPTAVDEIIDSYIVSGSTAFSSGWLSATSGGSALTPETNKIYIVLTDGEYVNKTYRWSGTTYVEISPSPAQATETQAGIAEIATQAEVNAGTDNQRFVTPLKLATLINGMTKSVSVNNPALTESSGYCTWVVTHNLNSENIGIHVYEISTGEEVMYDRSITTANTVTIKILSASNISANTYKAIIIG